LYPSSSSSGPGAYAPDALQPLGLLCDPETHHPHPWFRRSQSRRQVPPRPYDVRDPSSERWNCGRECCPVILPKLPNSTLHLGIFTRGRRFSCDDDVKAAVRCISGYARNQKHFFSVGIKQLVGRWEKMHRKAG